MSFFSELKRRNVVRVATAYVVVGWLLLQVADVVLDFAEAPVWIGKVLIALLLIGFVVALVLSWLFEATPEGIRRDDGSGGVDPVRAQRLNILTVAAAIGVAAMFGWQQLRPAADAPTGDAAVTVAQAGGGQSAGAARSGGDAFQTAGESSGTAAPAAAIDPASIAVLPFADLSPDGDQEYFSDGIAEEILNVLVRVEGLAVASRTSAFGFKGQEELGIPAIGRALRVRHILEGSVRSAGDSIRITAQLIDASTDKHLWSQTYDRKLSAETVFSIQDEIASTIVAELSKTLPIEVAAGSAITVAADTQNLDAYQLFLQGRQRFRVRSVDNIPGTIEIFRRAVELDPGFGRAWAGYSAILSVAPSWGFPGEGVDNYELSGQAARKALALDDSLALPYAVLASNATSTNNFDGAATTFDLYAEALERDPNEVNALLWRGIDYIRTGFFDAAITDLRRCQTLDPAYENCRVFEAVATLYKGDYDGMRRLLDEIAGSNSPSQALVMALAMVGREDALTAKLALAWTFSAFGQDIKPDLVVRALLDPRFDAEKARRDYVANFEALTGSAPDFATYDLLPLIFGRYEDMTANLYSMWWWHPSFPDFHASPHRKRLMRDIGLDTLWRARGFPPQCRPVGDDDFECDIPTLDDD